MHIIKTYIKAVCFFAALLLFQGCSQDGVIDKATMSRIVMEMYLADQYIEGNPQMRAQTDSLAVYPAIMEKYGYTMEEYSNSIRYWLQEDEEYINILKDAQAAMEERVEVLDAQIREIELLRRGPQKWWALDSVRAVPAKEFLYDHLLRGVRWLVVPGEELPGWKMNDSAVVDIPQNPQWWGNNMVVPEREHSEFFVRGAEDELENGEDKKEDKDAGKNDGIKLDTLKKPEKIQKNLKPYTKTDLVNTEDPGEEEEQRIQNAL